jgi:hypothetical protein
MMSSWLSGMWLSGMWLSGMMENRNRERYHPPRLLDALTLSSSAVLIRRHE